MQVANLASFVDTYFIYGLMNFCLYFLRIKAINKVNSMKKYKGIQVANWHHMSGGVIKAASITDKKKKVFLCFMQSCKLIKLYSIQNIKKTGTWEQIEAIKKKRNVNRIKSYILGCNFMIRRFCEAVKLLKLYKKNQIFGIIHKKVKKKNKEKAIPLSIHNCLTCALWLSLQLGMKKHHIW